MKTTEVQIVRRFHDLGSVRLQWDELHQRSGRRSVFQSYEFAELWFRCFASPDDVRVFMVHCGGRLIGVLPLVIVRRNGRKTLQSITNEHCLHSDPLVLPANGESFQDAVLSALADTNDRWDVLRHSFSYTFSPLPGLLSGKKLKERGVAWRNVVQPTYLVRLDKSIEEYMRGDISRNLKTSLARHRNRLRRCGTVAFEHLRAREAAESWKEFVEIEDSGWKGRAGSSIRRLNSGYQRFYKGLVELMAHMDVLNLHFLRVDGRYIAGSFSYVEGNVFHWFKTGYREDFAHLSPGNILLFHIIEELMNGDGDCRLLHMFPWDHGYKHRFANVVANSIDTILYNSTLRGRTILLADSVRDRVKSMLRNYPEVAKGWNGVFPRPGQPS